LNRTAFSSVLLEISGADAKRYLQGRLTQDISKLSAGAFLPSMLLSPQGRLQGLCALRQVDDKYELLTLGGSPEKFRDELLLFKVADDIEVELKPVCLSLCSANTNSPAGDKSSDKDLSLHWPGLIERETSSFQLEFTDELPSKDSTSADLLEFRIQYGLPLFGLDIKHGQVASLLPIKDWVSFGKGCYAGQEVVEKLDAYGRGKKKLALLSIPKEIEYHAEDQEGYSSLQLKEDPKPLKVSLSSLGRIESESSSRAFAAISEDNENGLKALGVGVLS